MAFRFIDSVWASFLNTGGLEKRLLQNLKITKVRQGRIALQLEIEKCHTNRIGILHGGTIAVMVDLAGSLVIASHGLFATGLSTDLNITYLNSGGRVGELLRVESVCEKIGKAVAFTSTACFNEANQLVARGSHTKYIQQVWKDERNKIVDARAATEKKSDNSIVRYLYK